VRRDVAACRGQLRDRWSSGRGAGLAPICSLENALAFSVLMPLDRTEEAVSQVRLAKKADPLSPFVERTLAYALFSAGRIDEAASHCGKPCARALVLQGKAAEAITILEPQFNGRLSAAGSGELGYAYALAGRRDDAERIASIQQRPIEQATVFTGLGDKDRAFEALDRAIPLGPVRIGRALTFPELARLRNDPRLKAVRKKVGLPE
jgi:tetratricopeptide (TPR) repeat protein